MKKKVTSGAVIREPGSSIKTKTGSWRTQRPVKDMSKCTNCGTCYLYCPDAAIDANLNINYEYCKGCGICAKVCPLKVIRMKNEEK